MGEEVMCSLCDSQAITFENTYQFSLEAKFLVNWTQILHPHSRITQHLLELYFVTNIKQWPFKIRLSYVMQEFHGEWMDKSDWVGVFISPYVEGFLSMS